MVLLDLVEGAYRHPKLDNFCPGFCQGKNFWTNIFEGLRTPLIKDCGTIPLSKLNSNAMTLVNTTNVPEIQNKPYLFACRAFPNEGGVPFGKFSHIILFLFLRASLTSPLMSFLGI